MASAHNNAEGPILDTYQAVVLAFSEFLTVAIHTILYERDIYPRESFLKARKYNYPVRQSRHPKVCKWIQDAVNAVEGEMLKCAIHSTSLILSSPPPTCYPLERYTFFTASFPQIPPADHLTPFFPPTTSEPFPTNPTINPATLPLPHPTPPSQNLLTQFRATLARFSSVLPSLAPLPADSTFSLAIELRDAADPPIGVSVGNVQPWIAAEPAVQRESQRGRMQHWNEGRDGEREGGGRALASVRTTPIRSLEAGAFVMEVWVEEGKWKLGTLDQ